MIITTTNNIDGYRIVEYCSVLAFFEESIWNGDLGWVFQRLAKKGRKWIKYGTTVLDEDDLESDELDQDDPACAGFAIVGAHVVSASTYSTDYYDNTMPDFIAYGTLVRIEALG